MLAYFEAVELLKGIEFSTGKSLRFTLSAEMHRNSSKEENASKRACSKRGEKDLG